jgi:hypothetical protein
MGADRLFKIGSFEEELATSMGKQLRAHQHEKQLGFDRRAAKAVDLINAASQLFDEAGFHSEAEALTRFLEKMAGKEHEHQKPVMEEQPEFFKMKSILPGPSNMETAPGADVIELETLAPEFEKEEELAPLRLLELGKKKVR